MTLATARYIQANKNLFSSAKVAEANKIAGKPMQLDRIMRSVGPSKK